MAKAVAANGKPNAPEATTPPARDPDLAVQEEYLLARRQGTVQSLERFIARHPDHPFAEKARVDLRGLPR